MNVRALQAPRWRRLALGPNGDVAHSPIRETSSAEKYGGHVAERTAAASPGTLPKHVSIVNRRRLAVVCLSWAFFSVITADAGMAQESFRLTPYTNCLLGMGSGQVLVSGDLLVPAGGRPGSGTRVDLTSDLGIDQAETTSISFHCSIVDKHRIGADYVMLQPTGYARPSHAFRFQNRTYQAGASLETRLDVNWLRFSYSYQALGISAWWIAPRVGVQYIRFATTINGETEEAGIVSNTRSLDCTFPVLGLETRYLFPYGWDVGLEVEGTYLLDRGFLTGARLSGNWEIHPEVVLSLTAYHMLAQSTEQNQPLNNQWSCHLLGLSAAVRFSF